MEQKSDFAALGIRQDLVDNLNKVGIMNPTPVQQEAIPAVLTGKSLVVQAPTGTGKTIAYLAPLFTTIEPESKNLEVVILAPSRELAMQVIQVIRQVGGGAKVASLIGGASPERQLTALKEKPNLAVGTPGRVLEMIQKRKINGQAIRTIVIDEADKMFMAGFMADVQGILKATLKSRQVLFFSATIPPELLEMLSVPVSESCFINIEKGSPVPETITHYFLMTDKLQRSKNLASLLRAYKPKGAVIFLQRNEGVGPLAGRLQEMGMNVLGMHSDLSQPLRKEVLEKFRAGKVPILVTTDLLARGLDIPEIDYIFNYDLPADAKHYLHRAGRTGRAGRAGIVITLVPEEKKFIIHKYAKELKIGFQQLGIDKEKVFALKYRSVSRAKGKKNEDE